jgi:hypothetical protein
LEEHAATFFRVQGLVANQTSESYLLLILYNRRWRQHVSRKRVYAQADNISNSPHHENVKICVGILSFLLFKIAVF